MIFNKRKKVCRKQGEKSGNFTLKDFVEMIPETTNVELYRTNTLGKNYICTFYNKLRKEIMEIYGDDEVIWFYATGDLKMNVAIAKPVSNETGL